MSRLNVALVAPLVLIWLVLLVTALVDLARRDRVRWGHKWLWAVVVVVFGSLGPLAYFTLGRLAD